MEVSRVERSRPHRLVDMAKRRHRERWRAESCRQRGVLELRACALQAVAKDAIVVENEPALRSQHPIDPKPLGRRGVAAGEWGGEIGRKGEVSDRHGPHPGIAIWLSIARELLEVDHAAPQAGLLIQLPLGA